MNLGLFLFTLLKLINLRAIMAIFFVVFMMPILFGVVAAKDPDTVELAMNVLWQTAIPMTLALVLVADNVANAKNLSDGEYLALLFTRPLRRANYVLSKWVAGSVGVGLCMLASYCVYVGVCNLAGGHMNLDIIELGSILLNCLSATALITVIGCVPLRMGLFLFVFILYTSMLGSAMPTYISRGSSDNSLVYVLGQISEFTLSILRPSIDLLQVANASVFSWTPILSYLSNLALYLCFAAWLLNRREFYYASD